MAVRSFVFIFVAFFCSAGATPPSITIIDSIDGDDMFNVTTGTPGSCSCETPQCNLDPSTGNRLFLGDSRTYNSDNCDEYYIGGGIEAQDGNPCITWQAGQSGCSVNPGGVTGNCSRLNDVSCTTVGSSVNLTASIDRTCDTLPYLGCTLGVSDCCGDNECSLADGSTTYYLCQPIVSQTD